MRKPIAQILSILRETLPYVQDLYSVKTMEVFGSYIRSEENDESDLDILVSFGNTPSLIKLIELENYLTDRLGIKVDLVMKEALKKNIRRNILREARPI
jgi:uncharacterized protein